jgi:hypothetical protein
VFEKWGVPRLDEDSSEWSDRADIQPCHDIFEYQVYRSLSPQAEGSIRSESYLNSHKSSELHNCQCWSAFMRPQMGRDLNTLRQLPAEHCLRHGVLDRIRLDRFTELKHTLLQGGYKRLELNMTYRRKWLGSSYFGLICIPAQHAKWVAHLPHWPQVSALAGKANLLPRSRLASGWGQIQ